MQEDLHVALTRIQVAQETILEKLEESKVQRDALAARVFAIESKINMAAGAIAVLTAGFTFFFQYVMQKFRGGA